MSINDEMILKVDCLAWLVWRPDEDGPEFLGIYPSQQDAEKEAAHLNSRRDRGWRVTCLLMSPGYSGDDACWSAGSSIRKTSSASSSSLAC